MWVQMPLSLRTKMNQTICAGKSQASHGRCVGLLMVRRMRPFAKGFSNCPNSHPRQHVPRWAQAARAFGNKDTVRPVCALKSKKKRLVPALQQKKNRRYESGLELQESHVYTEYSRANHARLTLNPCCPCVWPTLGARVDLHLGGLL